MCYVGNPEDANRKYRKVDEGLRFAINRRLASLVALAILGSLTAFFVMVPIGVRPPGIPPYVALASFTLLALTWLLIECLAVWLIGLRRKAAFDDLFTAYLMAILAPAIWRDYSQCQDLKQAIEQNFDAAYAYVHNMLEEYTATSPGSGPMRDHAERTFDEWGKAVVKLDKLPADDRVAAQTLSLSHRTTD